MKAGDKEKWKSETSSSLLVVAQTIGIANVVTCEDYSNLQRLFRVTALVLQFVKILKLRLQKNVETQKELTSQDIAVAETLWIKEIQKSLSKNPKFEMWKRQFSLESLFIHLSGQQGGSDTDVVTYVVISRHDYVRNVLWINKYEHAFKMAW